MKPELNAQFSKRFTELYASGREIRYPAGEGWHKWSTQVMHLLEQTFGKESPHHQKFTAIQDYCSEDSRLETALGVFLAAKSDFEAGHLSSLTVAITAEVLGDFLALSKAALADGKKDVAAVLACAALEDALKRFARKNTSSTDDKDMQNVINALRAKGLIGATEGKLLDDMRKLRDYSMHANWERIASEAVAGVIGFTEEFMEQRFR